MKTSRIISLVLGILGGLSGLGAAAAGRKFSWWAQVLQKPDAAELKGKIALAVVLSIVGIVAAAVVGGRPKVAGWVLVAVAILGYALLGQPYGGASLLFAISGILALVSAASGSRKKESGNKSTAESSAQ
jgi:uncharacterized membrane protein YgcG